jgi:hypothetical protein
MSHNINLSVLWGCVVGYFTTLSAPRRPRPAVANRWSARKFWWSVDKFGHYFQFLCLLYCFIIFWRARCRSTVNSGNACWQPLLGKQHVTCFLCGLTPACYATLGRPRFLRGLFRGNNSQCNSGCFLCGLFTGYIAGQLRGQWVNNG